MLHHQHQQQPGHSDDRQRVGRRLQELVSQLNNVRRKVTHQLDRHPQIPGLHSGTNRGRQVRLWGIVISRLRDGRIVEDWAAFDSLELLKQLGLLRTLLAAPALLGALRGARRS